MAGKHELEKFEYLFVDIEWNQTPGTNGIEDREPIQIGVVATDESMNLKKSFSRAMRLSSEEKYNSDTLLLSHSTLKSVMMANSEEIVLQKIEAIKIHKKCMEGYNKQKLPSNSLYDVVSYIRYHDESMLKRLGDKRNRVDVILDRIREQDAENMA